MLTKPSRRKNSAIGKARRPDRSEKATAAKIQRPENDGMNIANIPMNEVGGNSREEVGVIKGKRRDNRRKGDELADDGAKDQNAGETRNTKSRDQQRRQQVEGHLMLEAPSEIIKWKAVGRQQPHRISYESPGLMRPKANGMECKIEEEQRDCDPERIDAVRALVNEFYAGETGFWW
jgi:hypothetical protein